MIDDFRRRVMRLIGSEAPSSMERERSARVHRAELVARLQGDIHQLQLDIANLSDEIGNTEAEARSRQMSALHRDLKEKQDELGRYQARI